MSDTVIKVENVSKLYRLGEVGTGTLRHDLNRAWHRLLGKEDPYLKIGETNDRTQKGGSDYAWALKDVSFEVKRGEVLGIIGRNGAGKSTLLKILSRVTTPTSGEIKVKGRIASLLEVGTGFHPELSGRDNIYLNGAILGMRKHEIDRKFDEIVAFAEVERYIDTPVKRYSSGMYVRLAFAVAAHLEPEILIVDEVLAVGDAQFQKKCLGKMQEVSRQGGRTVIFVSHNMHSINALCSNAVLLSNGSLIKIGKTNEVTQLYVHDDQSVSNFYRDVSNSRGIRWAEIDLDSLNQSDLVVKVGFVSAARIVPCLGVVLYSQQDIPIFGTNARIYPPSNLTACKNGICEMEIRNVSLRSGLYKISLWLGDIDRNDDFDHVPMALSFNYLSKRNESKGASPDLIGHIAVEPIWRIYEKKL